jgi:hypothetical protein
MSAFFYTSASGWIASILIGMEILLPYLLRRTRLSESLGIAEGYSGPYLQRMWPHYWTGYLLLTLSIAHAWVPMRAGHMSRANMAGLSFASAALCLLLLQVALGLVLQNPMLQARKPIRGWHYWMMIALALCVTVHVWLNS